MRTNATVASTNNQTIGRPSSMAHVAAVVEATELAGGSSISRYIGTSAANVPAPVPTTGASLRMRSLTPPGEDEGAKVSNTLCPRSTGWAVKTRRATPITTTTNGATPHTPSLNLRTNMIHTIIATPDPIAKNTSGVPSKSTATAQSTSTAPQAPRVQSRTGSDPYEFVWRLSYRSMERMQAAPAITPPIVTQSAAWACVNPENAGKNKPYAIRITTST